jgi:hypothetical protein
MAFKRSVPLVVVDLPGEDAREYWELRHATDRATQITQSLLVVAGTGAEEGEEIWARSLGAWAYLNEAHSQRGFEFVLNEARQAIQRQAGLLEESQYAGAKQDGW